MILIKSIYEPKPTDYDYDDYDEIDESDEGWQAWSDPTYDGGAQ